MTKRQYDQPGCGLVAALNLLGERWTLLIVRELLVGPLRYTDILDRLPGMGTNLLANRLHGLEDAGVIGRTTMPPPAASTVYGLTELGRGLEPTLVHLATWGQNFVADDIDPSDLDARAAAFILRTQFQAGAASGIEETYQYEIGASLFHAEVSTGRVEPTPGPARRPGPDVVLRTDPSTFIGLLRGRISFDTALSGGLLDPAGDPDAARRAIDLFRPR